MKFLLLTFLLVISLQMQGQVISIEKSTTRAVVIGISDYKDNKIPDLQYAHRDAEFFANFLQSSGGGALQNHQIKLLTNEKATTGQFIVALEWLIEKSHPGDRAIIYFSGHSDVERITKFQRGYLLTYDSPPIVYGAGAFSLIFLQDVITTLSDAEVEVIMISDACRAGKLAGSDLGGTQATSAALARRFANEIKILSCQPDEFSVEGKEWGDGRGCFSYHLIDGLYGMADKNKDLSVNLMEIENYLEETVSKEVAPQSQIPMVMGNPKTHLVSINEEWLSSLKTKKAEQLATINKVDSRGIEDLILAEVDTSILELYNEFLAAIDRKDLMTPDSSSADYYFQILIEEPELKQLHGVMKRNFAAALMDDAQIVINRLLQTDPLFADNIWQMPVHFNLAPEYLHRAAEILGEDHYIYNSLKAKEYYFKGKSFIQKNFKNVSVDSLNLLKKEAYLTGLQFDEDAPFLHQALIFECANFTGKDTIFNFTEKLDVNAPSWALGQYTIGFYYAAWKREPDFENSIKHFKKVISIDSTFLSPYNWIAHPYDFMGNIEEAKKWRTIYVEKLKSKLEADTTLGTGSLFNDLGNSLWKLRRYEEAEEALLKGEKLSDGQLSTIYANLGAVYCDLREFEKAINAYQKHYQLIGNESYYFNPIGTIYHLLLNQPEKAKEVFGARWDLKTTFDEFDWAGVIYYCQTNQLDKAQIILEELTKTYPKNVEVHFWKGEIYRLQKKEKQANETFEKLLILAKPEYKKNLIFPPNYFFRLLALSKLNKNEEQEKAIIAAEEILNEDAWFHFYMACFYSQTGDEEMALEELGKAIELGWETNPLLWISGTVKDPFLDNIRESEGFKVLMKKYFPDQVKD